MSHDERRLSLVKPGIPEPSPLEATDAELDAAYKWAKTNADNVIVIAVLRDRVVSVQALIDDHLKIVGACYQAAYVKNQESMLED